jgi:hypothetical protein
MHTINQAKWKMPALVASENLSESSKESLRPENSESDPRDRYYILQSAKENLGNALYYIDRIDPDHKLLQSIQAEYQKVSLELAQLQNELFV